MDQILNHIRDSVPTIIAAVAILIIGWIVAAIIGRVVTVALRKSGISHQLERRMGAPPEGGARTDVALMVGRFVYYVILLLVLVAALEKLGLSIVTTPLNRFLNELFQYLPNIIGAVILAVIAWVIATIVRAVVRSLLHGMRFDERVRSSADAEPAAGPPLSDSIGDVAYWLILLLFLPAILSALGLQGLLSPVQDLVDKVLAFLPNMAAAAIILIIGWFVARLVGRIITNLLAAVGLDRLGARLGFQTATGGTRLSQIVGTIVYALILLPVITAALNALQLTAVTQPVSNLLNSILSAIPNIIVAALILAFAVFIARLLGPIVTNIVAGIGFNDLMARLGLGGTARAGRTPADLVGLVVEAAIIWFGIIQALQALRFAVLTALASNLIQLAGHILLGLIIILVGLYLARLAASAIRGSGMTNGELLAFAAQAAILLLAGAMGLRQMGIANQIINLAFGLLLAAIAVAVAIAFGVGGRTVARQELEIWVAALRSGQAVRSAEGADGAPPASGQPPARRRSRP